MKKNLFLLIIIIMNSCSVNGGFQGLFSYYGKVSKMAPDLIVNSSLPYCELEVSKTPKIYLINGLDMKKCIGNTKTLIYIWSPKCKSKVCIPLDILQKRCDESNIDLFIVAEYFDLNLMNKTYSIKRPIFGIDTKFYRTNLTSKYLSKFILDLVNKKDLLERFLYFDNGKYINSYDSLETLL